MSRVVSWRAEDPEHAALQVGRRPVQALWPLLRSSFRQVFLEPQRRTGAGTVSWRWRGTDPQSKPAAADLAVMRRRLGHALQDLSVELDHREGVVAGVGSWELHVSMEKLVSALLQASDEGLSVYLVQTAHGWRIRSWGFAAPAPALVVEETEAEAAQVDEVAAEKKEIRAAVAPSAEGLWAKWRWHGAATLLLVGGAVWVVSAWLNQPNAQSTGKSTAYPVSQSTAVANPPTETHAHELPQGEGTKSVATATGFVKPIRLELSSVVHSAETPSSGLPSGGKAGAIALATQESVQAPAASAGGMASGPEAKGDRAGLRTQAAAEAEKETQAEKDGAGVGEDKPPQKSAKGSKPSGQPAGGGLEQSPEPVAPDEKLSANARKTPPPSSDVKGAKPNEAKAEGDVHDTHTDSPQNKRELPKVLPRKEDVPQKPELVGKSGGQEEARRLVVVRREAAETSDDSGNPAEAPQPKPPGARETKPERPGLVQEEPAAPEKSVPVSANGQGKPKRASGGAADQAETSEPNTPIAASEETQTQKDAAGVARTTVETVGEPPAAGAAGGAVQGVEPGQLAPGAETLDRVISYRVTDWQLRRVRDVVLPTAPREEGQPDTRPEALVRAWEEARRRVPAGFNQPRVLSGWLIELKPAKPELLAGLAWTGGAGAEGTVTKGGNRVRASWSWAGLMPQSAKLTRLLTAEGREVVRLEYDAEARRVRVRLGPEVTRAVPWFQIELEDGGRHDVGTEWRWQSLERFRWSDARWERERAGGSLRVRCEPEFPDGPVLRSGTLGLVDARSGWALAVDLRVE